MFFFIDLENEDGEMKCPVYWQLKRIRRDMESSLAAECFAITVICMTGLHQRFRWESLQQKVVCVEISFWIHYAECKIVNMM